MAAAASPGGTPVSTHESPAAAAAAADSAPSHHEAHTRSRAPWPGERANPLSVLLLTWLDALLWRWYRKPLDVDDTYAVPTAHSAQSVRERVLAFRARHPDATFTSTILRAFALRWLAGFCAKCVFVTAYVLQPFWVGALVEYVNHRVMDGGTGGGGKEPTYFLGIHNGLLLATGLVVTSLVAILAVNHTFYHQTRYGSYLRTAVRGDLTRGWPGRVQVG